MKTSTRVCNWLHMKALICGLITLGLTTLAVKADEITVAKGASTKVTVAEGVKRITIANPNIIDAKPAEDGRAVTVSGLAEGSSALTIETVAGGTVAHRIIVRADLQGMLEEIKELLGDVEGLDVKMVGNKIVFKGEVATMSGYEKVKKVAAAYAGVILDMSGISKDINKNRADAILRDIGLEGITARIVEDGVVLEGVVYSEAEKARAEKLASQRIPKVTSFITVQEVMIETDVQFVEVNTTSGTDFGYNVLKSMELTAGGKSGGTTMGKPTPSWGVSGTATAKINALVGSGQGKVLVQKNVTAKSGSEGRAMVGGEFGVSSAGNVGGTLDKIQYGVILTVKPTLQGRDTIDSAVTIEVSMPVAAGKNAYSLDKNETKTTVRCKVGESVVLSGLVQALASNSKEKTPLVGDIPLLNLFFSEKTSAKQKKEVLVVLTPHVILPEAAAGGPYSDERKKILQGTDSTK